MQSRTRSGFTLAEMLIAMSLLAVMAAVTAPSVTRHVAKSAVVRTTSDLHSIDQAVGQFYANTERFPGSLQQLGTAITPSDRDLFGRPFPADLAWRWKGPYLGRGVTASGVPTGRGATIAARLDVATFAGNTYLRIAVGGVDRSTAQLISTQVDGDTLVGNDGLGDANGRVRWKAGGADTLVYLARVVGR